MMNNRIYLVAEFGILFLGLPLLFYFDLFAVPKIAALLGVTLGIVLALWFDSTLSFERLFRQPNRYSVRSLAVRSLLVALFMLGLVLLVHPDTLFAFPRKQPVVWIVVMLLYPLLSALPQELIYREFFFQRYRSLFPSEAVLGYASALAFALLHIIYDNWWAVGLSLAGGILFMHTYRRSGSLYWVTVEHAVYGCLVFTIGMGQYFYEPF
ncbi:MAG: CPBP family intramembrane glutamic endopeptidase [Balneolaceae bacterium]|nr:CPBP family intramembrane glutamic endopeptidase [Balneolaceae bacterium]